MLESRLCDRQGINCSDGFSIFVWDRIYNIGVSVLMERGSVYFHSRQTDDHTRTTRISIISALVPNRLG